MILVHWAGEDLPVTNLFDSLNEPCDDWQDAYSFVAGPMRDGKWLCGVCSEFVQPTLQ